MRINVLGGYVISNIELVGIDERLQEHIIYRAARRYDVWSLIILIGSIKVAYRCYQMDKKYFGSCSMLNIFVILGLLNEIVY